jgi:hypothetical protein
MVTIEDRLLGIWSETLGRKPSRWVEPTLSRHLARREPKTISLETMGQAADGKDPTEREKD